MFEELTKFTVTVQCKNCHSFNVTIFDESDLHESGYESYGVRITCKSCGTTEYETLH